MSAREQVGIDVVAHDMASAAIKEVGGALDGLGGSSTKAKTGLAGLMQDLELGRSKTLVLRDAFSMLGKAVPTIAMSGLGAAFGMALSGANELDAATRKLQADTGMTGEEAKKAGSALAGMYRNNLQGFGEIGAAMAKVHTDLGLTGEAATKTTGLFLKFATATGIDAATAVTQTDNALDAWNLTAADADALLNLLVASHQKYGGSIAENLTALGTLAPQMLALNMTVNETVGLLNLFETAGMDSGKAMFALNTAVQKIKPGEDLNDLIAQISAIEDPTLRAQAAVDLFGARGGVIFANALKPGITALSDFLPAVEDITDAVPKAAAAIESGFGAQFKLLMKNAQGALAEFGLNFDALIIAAAMFGPKFTGAITTALGGLAGLIVPKIVGAIYAATIPAVGAGNLLGSAIGGAMALAIPAGVALGIVAAGVAIALLIDSLVPGLAKQMHDDFLAGLGAVSEWNESGKATGAAWVGGFVEPVEKLGVQLGPTATAMDEVNTTADAGALSFHTYGNAVGTTNDSLGIFNNALGNATTAADTNSPAVGRVTGKVKDLNNEVKFGIDAIRDLATAYDTTWGHLSAVAQGYADDIYGPQLRAIHANDVADEIATQQAIIRSTTITEAERKAAADRGVILKGATEAEKQAARDRLVALQQEGLGIKIEMAGRGELSKKTYDALIRDLTRQANSNNHEVAVSAQVALAELAKLRQAIVTMPSISGGTSFGSTRVGLKGEGGPIKARELYLVGERGPELFMSETAGQIIPSVPAWAANLQSGASGIALPAQPEVQSTLRGGTSPIVPIYQQGSNVNISIEQHFGPSSVRSREDIADIGREMATKIRLLGLTGLAPRIAGA